MPDAWPCTKWPRGLPRFADLGGDVVVLHLTCDVFDAGSSNGINVGMAIDAARRSLDELYTIADRLGLRIACENLMSRGTPRPLCPVEQLRAFIDPYPTSVGICLDTGHALVNGLNPASEARAAGDRLIATHLQDTDGSKIVTGCPGPAGSTGKNSRRPCARSTTPVSGRLS